MSARLRRTDEALVTIATFSTVVEAALARGALEAIGIPALVVGEELGTFARYRGGLAETPLQVFESDRPRAIVALRRLQIRIVEPPDAGS